MTVKKLLLLLLAGTFIQAVQPEFSSNPDNSTVTKGQNVTLKCEVDGNPQPVVRWTKGGDAVNTGDPRINVSFTGNTSSLIIVSVVQADQGLYRCVANNSVNTATSYPGSLTVHLTTVFIFGSLWTQQDGSGPKVRYSWLRRLPSPSVFPVYQVNGKWSSVVPEVEIIGGQEQFVIQGGQLLLTCQYNALPRVSEVQWEKNGTLIIARNASVEINGSLVTIPHFNESQVQLEITATKIQDAGLYICLVINDIGTSSNTTSVVIQVEPSPPLNVTVVSKSSRVVNISWIAGFDGNSAIQSYTVERRKDNADLVDAACQGSLSDSSCVVSSTSASFANLSPWTTYSFKVFARNVVGTSNGSSVVNATTDEEVPSIAPNFDVTVVNSTAVNVSWQMLTREEARGEILGYYVLYNIKRNSTLVNRTVYGKETTSYVVTSIKKFTSYEFAMQAFNNKGVSQKSSVVEKKTDQDKPDGPPQNVTGQNSSSTSILVMWDEVATDKQNGNITGYNITYQSQTENDDGSVLAGPGDRQKNLTNLKEYVNYNITVFAFTVKGNGPVNDPVIVVRTDQDKPDGPPRTVRGQNSSSTSILVMWDEVPADNQNGIIIGYNITYESQTQNDDGSVLAGPDDRQKNLTNLKEYVNYNIAVFAITVKGNGPASDPIVVRTDQDKPDGPPQNVTGQNSSSTSILVMWDEIAADKQNGIITGYNITYQSQTQNDDGSVLAGPDDRQKNLTNLKEYVNYDITVFAFTVKGNGPASGLIVVRTDHDRPSAPPQDLRLKDTTSSSLLVGWNEVPPTDKNGIIISYTVSYQAISSALVENVTVFFPTREVNLTGLIKNIVYSVRVLASTDKGDGDYSDPEFFVTNQDVPSAAPHNVRGHNTSFTSILVTWDEVPANEQRGNIRYYTVIYKETQEGVEMSKQVDSPKRSVELTGLKRYAKYIIQVSAATVKGDGPASVPITVSTEQGIPSKAPVLTLVTVLNSTSVEVEWQQVPEYSRHGIITNYIIFYTFEKVTGEKQVPGSLLKVVVNGLRQSATYSFRVHAATVKGAGPASNVKNATTEDPPTAPTPPDGNIGTTEVSVPFKTKKELSNGKPVSFYQMIVTTLTDEQDPGKSSDEQYVKVMRNYDNQVKGEPYITAEFANDQSRTSFPVGDGKYYSRDGVTEAKRKRRKTFIKYQNGKLEEGTRYAVFQRSYDEDGDYENEGFITFTTKDDGIPTATLVLSIVVGLLVVLIVVIVIVMWRRRLHPNAETKSVSRNPQQGFTQEILELPPYSKPSTEPSYYNTALNEPETEGQFTYEAVDDVPSGQVTHYDDVGPQQGDIYQEIDSGVHYQPLNVNRQVTYQGYVKPKRI